MPNRLMPSSTNFCSGDQFRRHVRFCSDLQSPALKLTRILQCEDARCLSLCLWPNQVKKRELLHISPSALCVTDPLPADRSCNPSNRRLPRAAVRAPLPLIRQRQSAAASLTKDQDPHRPSAPSC
jgi:hypothetical protein